MAMKQSDTKEKAAESIGLSVSEGKKSLGFGAGSSKITNKKSVDQEIEQSCQALGGDVTLLTAKCTNAKNSDDQDNHQSKIRSDWCKTIRKNMVGFNFQLVPL